MPPPGKHKLDIFMISRRLLRIKVLQTLYAQEINTGTSVSAFQTYLLQNVKNTYQIYLHMLLGIREVSSYVWKYKQIIKERYVKTKEEENISIRIAETNFIKQLNEDANFIELLKKEKISLEFDNEMVKKLFYELKELEEFKRFNALENPTSNNERQIYRALFKKVILKNDTFTSIIEERFATWTDDVNTVINMTMATINEFFKHKNPQLQKTLSPTPWNEINQFSTNLFLKYLKNQEELHELVIPVLNNWAADRTNKLDMLIIKMALTELLYFEHVPVKVSINEYIEISKQYSTPKSKEFINGVLDTLLRKLKKENKINKKGRGLVE